MFGDDPAAYCPACGERGKRQTDEIAWCVNALCRVRGFEAYPTKGYLAALEAAIDCTPGIDC